MAKGFELGIGFTELVGGGYDYPSRPAPTLSLFVEPAFGSTASLRIALGYARRGAEGRPFGISVHYLELPVLGILRAPPRLPGGVVVAIVGGPVAAVKVGCDGQLGHDDIIEVFCGSGTTDRLRSIDFRGAAGLELSRTLDTVEIRLQARHERSLYSFVPYGLPVRHRATSVLIGISVPPR
jgi:hypothetical protein